MLNSTNTKQLEEFWRNGYFFFAEAAAALQKKKKKKHYCEV